MIFFFKNDVEDEVAQQSVATLNATFQFLVIYRYRYIDVCP